MPALHYARQAAAAGFAPTDSEYCAESNLHEIIGTAAAMCTTSSIIMLLRVLVRVFMTKSFGSDDYCMSVAWLMQLGVFICWLGERPYANGKHYTCITPRDFEMHGKWQYYHSLLTVFGLVLVKISIALFLMRLVPPGKRWKSFLWASIVFLSCFLTACAGTLIWQCVPVNAAWNYKVREKPGTTCFSNNTFSSIGLFNSSINCITDFLFAVLPIPIIVKLQINKRTKVTLAIILSFGYVACAAGIVKAVKQYRFFKEKDPFWHNSFNVWAYIELCVGIIAGSLPSLKPLFATLLSTTKSLVAAYSPSHSHNRTAERSDSVLHDQSDGSSRKDVKDIKLENWSEAMKGSRTSNARRHSRTSRNERASLTVAERAYSVRVGAGPNDQHVLREDDEWEDIGIAANESNERLHNPLKIHKEVEIFSTSQRRSGL